jgi:hypothetical protein
MRVISVLLFGVGVGASLTVDSLARNVERVESIREVKDVQRSFSQLSQFGRWDDMASLFSSNGTLQVSYPTSKTLLYLSSLFSKHEYHYMPSCSVN